MTVDHDYPSFIASEAPPASPEAALFHIHPVPLEKTVSYGKGAAGGAGAILRASQQLEASDGRGGAIDAGIHTWDPVDCSGTLEGVLEAVAAAVGTTVEAGKIPVVLGGEHAVTAGAVRGVRRHRERFGFVQIDAHADLRESYEGSRYSHACVARRVHDEGIPIFQIGVRSMSREESTFRRSAGIGHLDARDLAEEGMPDPLLPPGFPEEVYLSIDVDGFDPSVIPATGTPEPGGLRWWEGMRLLERIVSDRRIIGFDVTELAPIPGIHFPDYAAARLVYNLAGMILRSRTPV